MKIDRLRANLNSTAVVLISRSSLRLSFLRNCERAVLCCAQNMDELQSIRERWKQSDFLAALHAAWHLNEAITFSAIHRLDSRLTLRDLVFRACREAVERAGSGERTKMMESIDNLLE